MDGRGGKVNSVESVTGIPAILILFSSMAPSHGLLIGICVVLVKMITYFRRQDNQVRCQLADSTV